MAIVINGTTYESGTESSPLVFNGASVGKIVHRAAVGDTIVFEKYNGPASPVTVTASTTLTAGVDFPASTNITVCVSGGGGGGGKGSSTVGDGASNGGGGYAGEAVLQILSLQSNEPVDITIGVGGAGYNASSDTAGSNGGASSFGTYITASGGSVGNTNNIYFNGNGGSRTTCTSTYTDGIRNGDSFYSYYSYGGQAGAYGNGGNGGMFQAATSGGISAGGGAGSIDNSGSEDYSGGSGGRGQVVISW